MGKYRVGYNEYRDDRRFVMNLIPMADGRWSLTTYRNTGSLPAVGQREFDSYKEAEAYVKATEPNVPLESKGGLPVYLSRDFSEDEMEEKFEIYNIHLRINGLFSTLEQRHHVPFYVDERGWMEHKSAAKSESETLEFAERVKKTVISYQRQPQSHIFQGQTYRDDRIFVLNIKFLFGEEASSIQTDTAEEQCWVVETYRNTLVPEFISEQIFITEKAAVDYVKRTELTLGLISCDGASLVIPEGVNAYDYYDNFLSENALSSALEGFAVGDRGFSFVRPDKDVEPDPSPEAIHWASRNPWYGSGKHKTETKFALEVHYLLLEEGIKPDSEEYYRQLNQRVRAEFPKLEVRD